MFKIKIKGITHGWLTVDTFKTEQEAIKAMNRAIKAGRKATHIKIEKG